MLEDAVVVSTLAPTWCRFYALAALMMMGASLPAQSLQWSVEANERTIAALLRQLPRAQERMRRSGLIDQDLDGQGENGYLGELTGQTRLRDDTGAADAPPLPRPVIPFALRVANGECSPCSSVAFVAGYHVALFLPGPSGFPVSENADGGTNGSGDEDPDLCEELWCAYAWPVVAGRTGRAAFVINQEGILLRTPNTGPPDTIYEGGFRPLGDEAFVAPEDISSSLSIDGSPGEANDGNRWSPVEAAPLALVEERWGTGFSQRPQPDDRSIRLTAWGGPRAAVGLVVLISIDGTPVWIPVDSGLFDSTRFLMTQAPRTSPFFELQFQAFAIGRSGELLVSNVLSID